MEWYLRVIQNYATFEGRARRKEFWMFGLINIIIAIALVIVEGVIGSPGILGLIYSLAILLPSIAVTVRRLHDTGRSGWWWLISFVPVIGGIVLIIFAIIEGDAEHNEYGPNPKA